ncbi:MAG: GNAT family N-acetyltransferase [Candidatus Eremiobacteraeota bacterium]|nr:GNAT family N-acetyltransferase [Candidatus Eremiobacteraeota bacterium]MCW5869522.1 GNAT family N-acetyltransferase [Candidatus Eremiobacteraeota bacterium]
MKWLRRPQTIGLQFRAGRLEDLESLYALEVELFGAQIWSREHLSRALSDTGQEFRLALDGAQLVGYLWLDWTTGERGTLEVDGLVVAPAYRRRKIAERLLHWAVERAVQAGWPRLQLKVRADNLPALKLYSKFGFHKVEDLPGVYVGKDGLLLRLEQLPARAPEFARKRSQLEGWQGRG